MTGTFTKIVAALTMVLLLAPMVLAQQVTGRTLSEVRFNEGKARIAETGRNEWIEFDDKNNTLATFRETGRDDWSVYLEDAPRKIRLQLDVHRKMIGISQNGGAMGDYHAMTATSADPLVTGYKVMEVAFTGDGGAPMRMIRTEAGAWVAKDASGKQQDEATEGARTEWTVEIKDRTGRVVVLIDCLRKSIRALGDDGKFTDYFPITRLSAIATP